MKLRYWEREAVTTTADCTDIELLGYVISISMTIVTIATAQVDCVHHVV